MKAAVRRAAARPYRIGMLLLPGFSATATLGFLDPLRAANYIHGSQLYRWQFLSLDGEDVVASNEAVFSRATPMGDAGTDWDLVMVNASWTPERFRGRPLGRWLVALDRAGCALGAMDTGAFVLAHAGLLDEHRTTVHYEHYASFRELYPRARLEEALYVLEASRMACSGGVASVDMALRLIQLHHGLELANAAAVYLYKDRHRAGNEVQTPHDPHPVGYTLPPVLREAIVLMEKNIEEPLTLGELSGYLDISQRQLARVFRRHTGLTPVRYYLNLRLDRARSLITQTELRIAEVANACGFGTAEQFSRAYRAHFDITPSRDRVEGRVPFQFRSSPAHGSYS